MSSMCSLCGSRTDHPPVGFCQACARTLPSFAAHMESMGVPAALISRDHTVLLANALMHKLSRTAVVPHETRIGELLGCRYALFHGSCGETFACPLCGIRRLVELSRLTGEQLADVPTTVRQVVATPQYAITAERAGEAVLLSVGIED